MSVSVSRSDPNIQEKLKTNTNKAHRPVELQVMVLAGILRSPRFLGKVLRVLVDRLRHPDRPYTNRELEVLLLLTLALERAGMWPVEEESPR